MTKKRNNKMYTSIRRLKESKYIIYSFIVLNIILFLGELLLIVKTYKIKQFKDKEVEIKVKAKVRKKVGYTLKYLIERGLSYKQILEQLKPLFGAFDLKSIKNNEENNIYTIRYLRQKGNYEDKELVKEGFNVGDFKEIGYQLPKLIEIFSLKK
ncbi:MAG: hypothetical protein ACQBVK_03710 [Candidatus Phytoplasma sp. TWB_XP]